MSNHQPATTAHSWEYSLTLPHSAIGSGVARSTVRSILVRHSLTGLADTAELLTSELCSNSYRYADGPEKVSVRRLDGTVHVSVQDSNSVLPSQLEGGEDYDGGRGLILLSRCADAWGSRPEPMGKVTWFELRE